MEIFCMKMEKWDIMKLFQELGGGVTDNDGGGKFNYDIL
jgi:hypothetical protein